MESGVLLRWYLVWGNAFALEHVDEVAVSGEFVDEGGGEVGVFEKLWPPALTSEDSSQ